MRDECDPFLPSDVAWSKQFPSPLVSSGYSFEHGNFLFTHQFRRSSQRSNEYASAYM